jgi:tetratricopeptide (TPR) repeat protein
MQTFNVNSTIRFKTREYQLRTSNNGQQNKIVCSFFRNGEFINSREMKYGDNDDGRVLKLIKKYHEQRKAEIESYFNLSEKLNHENNFELQNMLGLIFARNNMHLEAIREFGNIINLNPNDTWAYNNLGKALLSLKKYDAALKAFQRAITLSPNYADLFNNCGLVHLEIGHCKDAVEQFDKAIELNPYYSEAYFNKALAYVLNQVTRNDFVLTQNYLEDVQKCFDKARLINPSYQNEHYQKGLEYIKADDPRRAFEELKKCRYKGTQFFNRYDKYEYYLKLFFVNDSNHFEMIWKYIKFLQELARKYPNHADIYNDLGLAYCMLRNYINEKAINSFKHALSINPEFERAKRNHKLSSYEKTGSELFLRALTTKQYGNGRLEDRIEETIVNPAIINNIEE